MRRFWLFFRICSVLACSAKASHLTGTTCPDGGCTGGQGRFTFGFPGPAYRDVIVVIDDTVLSSIDGPKLERALRSLAASITDDVEYHSDTGYGLDPGFDYNIAVVSAAGSSKNNLWPSSASCAQPTGQFLHVSRLCDAASNFQGDLADVLACNAMHMPASGQKMRPTQTLRALLEPGGMAESTGFRRHNASLLVAIVATEDDPDVADSATMATVGNLFGANSVLGVVAPAQAQGLIELGEAHDSGFSDIVEEFWGALAGINDPQLMRDGGYPCFDWNLSDTDPDTPGVQPDCQVTERRYRSSSTIEEVGIEPCLGHDPDAKPCWRIRNTGGYIPCGHAIVVDWPKQACLPDYSVGYTFACSLESP